MGSQIDIWANDDQQSYFILFMSYFFYFFLSCLLLTVFYWSEKLAFNPRLHLPQIATGKNIMTHSAMDAAFFFILSVHRAYIVDGQVKFAPVWTPFPKINWFKKNLAAVWIWVLRAIIPCSFRLGEYLQNHVKYFSTKGFSKNRVTKTIISSIFNKRISVHSNPEV